MARMISECDSCDGTKLLLGDPCPLCGGEDRDKEDEVEGKDLEALGFCFNDPVEDESSPHHEVLPARTPTPSSVNPTEPPQPPSIPALLRELSMSSPKATRLERIVSTGGTVSMRATDKPLPTAPTPQDPLRPKINTLSSLQSKEPVQVVPEALTRDQEKLQMLMQLARMQLPTAPTPQEPLRPIINDDSPKATRMERVVSAGGTVRMQATDKSLPTAPTPQEPLRPKINTLSSLQSQEPVQVVPEALTRDQEQLQMLMYLARMQLPTAPTPQEPLRPIINDDGPKAPRLERTVSAGGTIRMQAPSTSLPTAPTPQEPLQPIINTQPIINKLSSLQSQEPVQVVPEARTRYQEQLQMFTHMESMNSREPFDILGDAFSANEVLKRMNQLVDEELAAGPNSGTKKTVRKAVVATCLEREASFLKLLGPENVGQRPIIIKDVERQWAAADSQRAAADSQRADQCEPCAPAPAPTNPFSGEAHSMLAQGSKPLTQEEKRVQRLQAMDRLEAAQKPGPDMRENRRLKAAAAAAANAQTARPPLAPQAAGYPAVAPAAKATPEPKPAVTVLAKPVVETTSNGTIPSPSAPLVLCRSISTVKSKDVNVLYGMSMSLEPVQVLSSEDVAAIRDAMTSLMAQPLEQTSLAYRTLLTVCANIIEESEDEKVRTLKVSTWEKQLLGIPGVPEILSALGFQPQTKEGSAILHFSSSYNRMLAAWPILLGHARAFLIDCISRWIHQLCKKTSEEWKDSIDPLLQEINNTVSKLLKRCFGPNPRDGSASDLSLSLVVNTALSADRAQGLVKALLATGPHALKVISALRAILEEVVTEVVRTCAYEDEQPLVDTPCHAASTEPAALLPAGARALIVQDCSGVSPWLQVLGHDKVAYVSRFNASAGEEVCEVLVAQPSTVTARPPTREAPLGTPVNELIPWLVREHLQQQQILEEKLLAYAALEQERSKIVERASALQDTYCPVEYGRCGSPFCMVMHERQVWTSIDKEAEYRAIKLEAEGREPEVQRSLAEAVRIATLQREVLSVLQNLGMDPEKLQSQVLGDDGTGLPAAIALSRVTSVPHPVFKNTSATCWLSSTFQVLWHSSVFRRAFGCYMRSCKAELSVEPQILQALIATWERCSQTPRGSEHQHSVVELQDAMERHGFQDVSDALNILQARFEDSPNPVANCIASNMACNINIQLHLGMRVGSSTIGPIAAWDSVESQGSTQCPLIAVSVDLPSLEGEMVAQRVQRSAMSVIATAYVPKDTGVDGFPDLGQSHRLVAMVLYLDDGISQHYIVLCRSLSDPRRCRVFNDLPNLLQALPVVMEWSEVPAACFEHGLFPRLMLYESVAKARSVAMKTQCWQAHCSQM